MSTVKIIVIQSLPSYQEEHIEQGSYRLEIVIITQDPALPLQLIVTTMVECVELDVYVSLKDVIYPNILYHNLKGCACC